MTQEGLSLGALIRQLVKLSHRYPTDSLRELMTYVSNNRRLRPAQVGVSCGRLRPGRTRLYVWTSSAGSIQVRGGGAAASSCAAGYGPSPIEPALHEAVHINPCKRSTPPPPLTL